MIVGLFPELLSIGGVPRAGRHAAAVLRAYAQQRGTPYRFLSLNDPSGMHQVRVGSYQFLVSGFGRMKTHFVLTALRTARMRPRLVLAAHPNLAPVVWAMKALALRLRSVVLAHGIEVWTPLPRLRQWALRRADRVLAPSADTARQLVAAQGVAEQKIRRVPWGLDPEFGVCSGAPTTNHLPLGFPAGRVVLTVGRWMANERYKGVDNLIRALVSLMPKVPDLYLVAVGDGDDRPRLEQLALEQGVANQVRFLNDLSPEELMACYRRCDVFALPSRGEGFGMVFLEAMAQGKPVVGGAHGGTPDIIEDGVTGFLVAYGDVGQLAEVLESVLSDDEFRLQIGQRARERARTTYLFEHFRMRLTQIIEDVCAS